MEKKDENNFVGHKLNGSNYQLWKFQMNAYMKARGLTDNVQGKEPSTNASAQILAEYERNEGKSMNALIQSLDSERANFVLSCTTAKQMVDKLSSIYEKNSEIRVMNLYEEYFSLKMKEDDSVANYVSKVNQLASEIEAQGEKLSDKMKMCRIISSLPNKFNNYKTVWYNTKESRTLDTMLSSLQLEEDNLKKNDANDGVQSNVAFAAKAKYKSKSKKPVNIDELKKKTKCNVCQQVGHWARECPQNKNGSKPSKKQKEKNDLAFYATINSDNNSKSDIWIADSGASSHMSFHYEWFTEYSKYSEKRVVQIANNECLAIHGVGTILIECRINGKWEPRRLEKVLYVPDLKQNLFSTAAVTSKGFKMLISKDGCKLLDAQNDIKAVGVKDETNQLRMEFRRRIDECANTAAVSLQQWHRRLGHINVDCIKKMYNGSLVNGLNLSDNNKFFCDDCQFGKMTRSSHRLTPERPAKRGEFLHADLCGPMEEEGIGGIRFYLLIKDEATSFRYIFFLHSKNEVYDNLCNFIPMVNNTIGSRIKHIRFDNGLEFVNKNVKNLLSKEGIVWERISPYTPEQNGRIERDNRTIQESARTMLIASGLKKYLWPEAVRAAVYMLNRSTNSKCIDSTPFEKWFDSKPELGHVKIFGSECFVQIPKQLGRKKWDPKAKKVYLVGFEPTSKNYRLFDPNNRKIFVSCNVRFNETESKIIFTDEDDEVIKETSEVTNEKLTVTNNKNDQEDDVHETNSDHDIVTDNEENQVNDESNKIIRKNDRYNLRPIIKAPDRLVESSYSAVVIEPVNYEEALQSSERDQWQKAIDDELNSLHVNETWELVKRPKNVNIVGCKWVFKRKPSANGNTFKARLVAKGFSQREGVDFNETFSPVVRYDSIRTILSIAAIEDWEIMQFDVKTAFLNGDLDTTIYMEVPEGVEAKNNSIVCCLKKSLYGLKQASRVWNETFTKFLKDYNMIQSAADSCVFRGETNGQKVILLLYVDDGLVLSSSEQALKDVMDHLLNNFKITKGFENHYVGIAIKYQLQPITM